MRDARRLAPTRIARLPPGAEPSVPWSMADRPRPPRRLLTIDEYLRFEARSPVRHEYVAGRVFPMSGVSVTHDRIVRNVVRLLDRATFGAPCELFSSHVMIRVEDRFYYPDLIVRCGERLPGDTLVLTDPCLLVEVLSPSTRAVDRRDKRPAYQRIAALRTYLIVDQARRLVERYWRDDSGVWQFAVLVGHGTIPLDCPAATLTLDDVYADTDVPERPLRRVRERTAAAYGAGPSASGAPGEAHGGASAGG